MNYEECAIGWREPDDHEVVRYQPTIVVSDDSERRRYWIDPRVPGESVFKAWIRDGQTERVVGPVLYRSRRRAIRIARRKVKRIVRYADRYGLNTEELRHGDR